MRFTKTLLSALVALSCLAVLSREVLDACGSKFLVGGRAARYGRMQAANPASVLVYWKQDANTPAADRWNPELDSVLEKIGYSIQTVADSQALQSAIQGGEFDIVMMGLDDAKTFQRDVQTLSPDSVLLPFVDFPTRREYNQAKEEFEYVLKTPTTMRRLLSVMAKSQEQ